mmetsp:Transcript_103262/g.205252  ORF Transcript_103262/g.205252 Transcript_103262/m.205252 type:complete len:145 (+) Transcript_103262:105-539(+)
MVACLTLQSVQAPQRRKRSVACCCTFPLLCTAVLLIDTAFVGPHAGPVRPQVVVKYFNSEDPYDERYKNRKFDWFFTSGEFEDEDFKVVRPDWMPPWFFEWFFEQGVYLAVFQGLGLIVGIVLIFKFFPFFANFIILGKFSDEV